jgi:hypothetical protein
MATRRVSKPVGKSQCETNSARITPEGAHEMLETVLCSGDARLMRPVLLILTLAAKGKPIEGLGIQNTFEMTESEFNELADTHFALDAMYHVIEDRSGDDMLYASHVAALLKPITAELSSLFEKLYKRCPEEGTAR